MRKLVCATVGTLALLGLTGCDMTRKPKDSYIDRVEKACGARIAIAYANTKWQDRDYAQDSLQITCILFPADTRDAAKREVN